jgi:phage repressor protein C with HTH and peptisase S24 domain
MHKIESVTTLLANSERAAEDDGERESAAWVDRLRQLIAIAGTATALAKKTGISQSGLSRYLAGGEPSRRVLVALAQAAGVRVLWLATGEGPQFIADPDAAPKQSNLTLLPFYDVPDTSRNDVAIANKPNFTSHAFCRFWLKGNGLDSNDLAVMQVKGDSMAPTLHDGDIILIDAHAREVEDDKVYLIKDSGNLLIRRLQVEVGARIRALTDNPAHREFTTTAEELDVIGRVVWRGSLL